MSGRNATATAIWQARSTKSGGDRAYFAYSLVLGGLIVVAPAARALWRFLTGSAVSADLLSPSAAGVAAAVVCGLWALALLAGRSRGPALLAPFLVYALAESDLSRFAVFRRRMAIAVVSLAIVAGIAAATVAGSLASNGLIGAGAVLAFTAAGALVGVLAAVLWLVGQCYPRAGASVALVMLCLGAAGLVFPFVRVVMPWGWAASVYPGAEGSPGLGALAAVALAGVLLVPVLLSRLRGEALAEQAGRWDTAIAHAISLDVNSVASTYQARPSIGRRLRAVVRSSHPALVFVVRDVVGAVRTPVRFVIGAATLAAAGAVVAIASAGSGYGALLGAAAGALAFVGFGAITDGVYHAGRVAGDLPLYGIDDGRLLAVNSLLPLVVGLVATCGGAVAVSTIAGIGSLSVMLPVALAMAVIVLATRVSDALRGPSPSFLLTPVPSPMGDPMPVIRVLWSLDSPLFAVLAGITAAFAGSTVAGLVIVAVVVVGFGSVRWLRRA